MLGKGHILAIFVIGFSVTTVLSLQAQEDLNIPQWVKNNALWWGQGSISDSDFMSAISFLIEKKLIRGPSQEASEQNDYSQKLQSKIIALQDENQKLRESLEELKKQNTQSIPTKSQSYYDPAPKPFLPIIKCPSPLIPNIPPKTAAKVTVDKSFFTFF